MSQSDEEDHNTPAPAPHLDERARRLKTVAKYYADIRANSTKPTVENTHESMEALKTIHGEMGDLRMQANQVLEP